MEIELVEDSKHEGYFKAIMVVNGVTFESVSVDKKAGWKEYGFNVK